MEKEWNGNKAQALLASLSIKELLQLIPNRKQFSVTLKMRKFSRTLKWHLNPKLTISSSGNQSFHLFKCKIFLSFATKWMPSILLQWTWESLLACSKRCEAVLLRHKCRQGLRCKMKLWVDSRNLCVFSFCRGTQQTKRVEGGLADRGYTS